MFVMLSLICLLILLNVAACYWGADSTDSIDSAEWQRRWNWNRRSQQKL